MDEPSVLDYLKAKLMPWQGRRIELPPRPEPPVASEDTTLDAAAPDAAPDILEDARLAPSAPPPVAAVPRPIPAAAPRPSLPPVRWPWRSVFALGLAIAAQRAYGPPQRAVTLGTILLLLALAWGLWAAWRGEWQLASGQSWLTTWPSLRARLRLPWLGLALGLAGASFLTTTDGEFTRLGLLFGLAALLASAWSFGFRFEWLRRLPPRLRAWSRQPRLTLTLDGWGLLVLLATAAVLFFRFYRLANLPSDMVSDHAEKYLDVMTILRGNPLIFFPRNGGREAFQFYLLAWLVGSVGLPMSFFTLKLSTTLIGLAALPFVYFLGAELGSRRVGLLAALLMGISYWGTVVSRAGMRLPFYFLFTAAVLLFFVRGLRRRSPADLLLCGVFVGLSLYGYSADRILPLLVIVGLGLYLLHGQARGGRVETIWWTAALVLLALIVFLPLLRYILFDPQGFAARMTSRMGGSEIPLPGPVLQIFLSNVWNALRMFSWGAGVVWAVSIPDYPALGVVEGGLFYLGAGLVLLRYLRRRDWSDLFLLLTIPLLLLPSIMALAFPNENPNLYRTGGAIVPVFLLIALALDGLIAAFERQPRPSARLVGWGMGLALISLSAVQSYSLVFDKYDAQYRLSAWNTSEMGTVIRDYADTFGTPDTTWVMGYPYWVDTRLVALNAGFPNRDYALFVDGLAATETIPGPKLFILNPLDNEAVIALRSRYPNGWLQTYRSAYETKDFLMYFTPPQKP